MEAILERVERAKQEFSRRMDWLVSHGGLTRDMYHRFLSMQYHLTKGVQRPFMIAASHPSLVNRRSFRTFLFNFAIEEETHWQMAERDLAAMGLSPLPKPLDVRLWWAFFESVVIERPFVRLGATPILENITAGSRQDVKKLIQGATFLEEKNTRFLVLHQHEDVPHGDQILDALANARLTESETQDLCEGADITNVVYMRLIDWVLTGQENRSALVDA